MIRLTRGQIQPIGLDLGQDSIKMLQLEVMGESLSVVSAAKQVLPDEVREHPELRLPLSIDAVQQMLRSNSFSGKSIIACLPREMVHVKNLRLPMMPLAEVESAVQFEAKNIFPFDIDQATLRFLPAGEVRQGADTKLEVIALAVRQSEIDAFVEQLHRTGCVIESLDFEPSAIYRSVERFVRRRDDESDVNVLVEIGTRRTQVIIGKGRDISFYKPIDVGSQHLQQDVARKLGITEDEARTLRRRLIETGQATPADNKSDSVRQAVHDAIRSRVEELAREIGLCLRYYSVTFRGQRPGKLRLLGGEAGDAQMVSILGAALPIPVETGKPLMSADATRMDPSDRRGPMSEWAVACGLGLKLTKTYFGSRDGKKRDPNGGPTLAPPPETPGDVEIPEIVIQPATKQEAAHA